MIKAMIFLEVPLSLHSSCTLALVLPFIQSVSNKIPRQHAEQPNSNGAAVMFVFVELMACNVYCDVDDDDNEGGRNGICIMGVAPPRLEFF